MSTDKPNTKAEIEEKLVALFREKGYEGVSLSDISEATGLGRASLYHHFPGGKAEMASASVACLGRWGAERLLPFAAGGTPAERLVGVTKGFESYFDGGDQNCLLAMLAAGDAPAELTTEVQQMGNGLMDVAAAMFTELGLPQSAAAEEAERFFVELHGAVVVSRTAGDTGPFRRAIERLRQRIATLEKEYAT